MKFWVETGDNLIGKSTSQMVKESLYALEDRLLQVAFTSRIQVLYMLLVRSFIGVTRNNELAKCYGAEVVHAILLGKARTTFK